MSDDALRERLIEAFYADAKGFLGRGACAALADKALPVVQPALEAARQQVHEIGLKAMGVQEERDEHTLRADRAERERDRLAERLRDSEADNAELLRLLTGAYEQWWHAEANYHPQDLDTFGPSQLMQECRQAIAAEHPGQALFDRLRASEARAGELERWYRQKLWLSHGHTALYGDDGELQCSQCPLDFRREPLEVIHKQLMVLAALPADSAPADDGRVAALEKALLTMFNEHHWTTVFNERGSLENVTCDCVGCQLAEAALASEAAAGRSEYVCPTCRHMKDTPMHELGCKAATGEGE